MTGFVREQTSPLRVKNRETDGALEKRVSRLTKKKKRNGKEKAGGWLLKLKGSC